MNLRRSAVAGIVLWWVGSQTLPLHSQQPIDEFSCASFPADLTEATLIDRYREENVIRAPVVGSDDGPQDGTIVFEGTPRQLEVVWRNPESRGGLAWIRSRQTSSPWRTSNGISIGMSLRDLEQRNGWPFRLRGLGGPEGLGRIRSWGEGRWRDAGEDAGCRLTISLQPSGSQRFDAGLSNQVRRGSNFSSGHPGMQAINPRVVSLSLVYDSTPTPTR
jgi:hypothetical protein